MSSSASLGTVELAGEAVEEEAGASAAGGGRGPRRRRMARRRDGRAARGAAVATAGVAAARAGACLQAEVRRVGACACIARAGGARRERRGCVRVRVKGLNKSFAHNIHKNGVGRATEEG
jgi:hypothetical protein